jgi:hypothetical protein
MFMRVAFWRMVLKATQAAVIAATAVFLAAKDFSQQTILIAVAMSLAAFAHSVDLCLDNPAQTPFPEPEKPTVGSKHGSVRTKPLTQRVRVNQGTPQARLGSRQHPEILPPTESHSSV